jgi:hypothetical protein
MNYFQIFLSFWITLMFCTSAAALDFQQGIHGMKWGSPITEYGELAKVHETDYAAYYANPNMVYQSANQPVPGVFYGFHRDRFFAVFIKLRSPDQFSHLAQQFKIKHGRPKTTYNAATRQTVHRWIDKELKIKLKMREAVGEYKLAIYYSPLAVSINENQLESIPPQAYGRTPSNSANTGKPMPLLGF